MGSLAAGIQDAAACLNGLQRSSTALSAAGVAALLSDQAPAVKAAGIQDAAACWNSLQRTNTALSAAGIAALLSDKEPAVKVEPLPAASVAAAAADGNCAVGDLALAAPAEISGHIAALHHQCEELQARIDSMETAGPAGTTGRAAATAAAIATKLQPPARLERHPAVQTVAPVVLPQQQQQRSVSLQSHGSWQSSTPSSLASGATAAAATPTASHMDLVEMVVQQLEDSNTSAEADKLEALLDRELRAAAKLPPEFARHCWATQLNTVINGISSAISSSCSAPLQPACYSQRAKPGAVLTTAAAAAVASGKGALGKQPAGASNKVQSAAGGVPALAVVESMLDMRLVSLQQQVTQLQDMVYGLREQYVMSP
jgi:hypothetical protein